MNILLKPSEFFANLVVNIIMRIVGAFIRTAIISIALIGFLLVIFFGVAFLVLWTILPILIGHFFIIGLQSLFI